MPSETNPPYDPLFVNARREAWLILAAWAVCLVWTVGFSALTAYAPPSESVSVIFGMPSWVFWGVVIPWVAATLFSVWFGLFYMADDAVGMADKPEG